MDATPVPAGDAVDPAVLKAGDRVRGNDDGEARVVAPVQGGSATVLLRTGQGGYVQLPVELLSHAGDGRYRCEVPLGGLLPGGSGEPESTGNDACETRAEASHPLTVPVIEETLRVGKREVTTGLVRIDKTVEERTETVDQPLFRDEVQVERRAANRVVSASQPPVVHEEGDVLVIPVLEEVLVVEKRLMLKEELLVRRSRTEFRAPQQVVLRREQVAIERIPGERGAPAAREVPGVPRHDRPSIPFTHEKEANMNTALVGVFESREQADRARQELLSAGFAPADVLLRAGTPGATGTTDIVRDDTGAHYDDDGSTIGDWFRSLFGFADDDDDLSVYSEAIRRGNYLVTVNAANDDLVDTATDILERCGSIDIDERATQWQQEGWQRSTAAGLTGTSAYDTSRDTLRADTGLAGDTLRTGAGAGALGAGAAGALAGGATLPPTAERLGDVGEVTRIPVIEEEMRVGKREVRRGGIRVYTRVIDTPVEETVHLREEHASVERRPVDRPATEADLQAMREGTVEVRETSEEAVVSKDARVVEEVEVGKTVTEREETVRDTVRRTDVQVEETDATRPLAGGGTLDRDSTLTGRDSTLDPTRPKDLGRRE